MKSIGRAGWVYYAYEVSSDITVFPEQIGCILTNFGDKPMCSGIAAIMISLVPSKPLFS